MHGHSAAASWQWERYSRLGPDWVRFEVPAAAHYRQGVLRLTPAWVWDSWYVDDGVNFHAFYLKASRALGDPERRHHWPAVGHAISADLVAWTEMPDALVAAEPPAFDDQGIWTGSIVADEGGTWHLFFTGIDRSTMSAVQRIGHATSTDLIAWERVSVEPVVTADPRWYQSHATSGRQNWRDPWVMRERNQWRMLITAESVTGMPGQRGCIGTAVSEDLANWTVQPPLVADVGLRQLEVPQIVEPEPGRHVLVFCMCSGDVQAPGLPRVTGTWTAPADSPAGPYHLDRAEPVAVDGNYAGRVVIDRAGVPNLMAFVDVTATGAFGGYLGNPIPLELTDRGTLQPLCENATGRFRGEA